MAACCSWANLGLYAGRGSTGADYGIADEQHCGSGAGEIVRQWVGECRGSAYVFVSLLRLGFVAIDYSGRDWKECMALGFNSIC